MKLESQKSGLPTSEQQEFYRFGARTWNVTRAKHAVKQLSKDCASLDVVSWAEAMGLNKPLGQKNTLLPVNDSYAMALTEAQLQCPVIVASVKLGKGKNASSCQVLIDGSHRLRAALLRGISELPCYVLNQKQALECEVK
jgi:hypothetical protein